MIRQTVLDNGVTVVTNQFPSGTASFNWTIAAGTSAEPKGYHGAAHAFEHVTCNVMRVVRPIENMGCDFNAGTNHEMIRMSADVWADKARPTLRRLLQSGLRNPAFTAKDWERESARIHMEIIEDEQSKDIRMLTETDARMFGSAPRGRTVLGTHADIDALNIEKLRWFHKHILAGPAITVCAAGAVSHQAVVDETYRQLRDLPAHSSIRMPASRFRPGGLGLVRDDLPANELMVLYRAAAKDSPDRNAHLVLQQVLAGDMQSYIFNRLSFRGGLVYSITGDMDNWRDDGAMRFNLTLSPDNTQQGINEFARQMEKMPGNLRPRDHARARQRYNFVMQKMVMTPELWVQQAANDVALFGRVRSLGEIRDEFNAITFEKLQETAASMVSSRPFVTAMGRVGDLRITEPFAEARERRLARAAHLPVNQG